MAIRRQSRKHNTKLYVNGVYDATSDEVNVMRYNPSASYTASQAVNVNGVIYLVGTDEYFYKFENYKWSRVGRMPVVWDSSQYASIQVTGNGSRVIQYNNGIALLSSHASKYFAGTFNGTTWTTLANLRVDLENNCGVVYDGNIHVFGSSNTSYAGRWYYYNGSSWVEKSGFPYSAVYSDAIVYNNEIHLFGGTQTNTTTNHYVYNGTSWSQSTAIPDTFSRSYGKAIIYDNKIYLLGCASGTKTYIWDGSSWSEGNELLYPMQRDAVFVLDNRIFRTCGGNISSNCYAYDQQLVYYKMV